jgi:radical SAM protein with 4Fe4S-binding SPASM domain
MQVSKVVILKLLEYDLVRDETLDRHPELVKKYLPTAITSAQDLGIELILPPDYIQILSQHDKPEVSGISSTEGDNSRPYKSEKVRNCLDPWVTAFVTIDGEVYPCCNIRKSLGNLKYQSLKCIWFGAKLTRLQHDILSGNSPHECLVCPQRGITSPRILRLKVALLGITRNTFIKRLFTSLASHHWVVRVRRSRYCMVYLGIKIT